MQRHRLYMLAALSLLATGFAPAQAQSLIWRNDWTVQSPSTLQDFYTSYTSRALLQPTAISRGGELLLRTAGMSELDDQIIRFTATGAVRWRANIGTLGSAAEEIGGAMVGNADGSAYVSSQLDLAVTKIAADGSIAWTSMQRVYGINALTDQIVAVLSCNSVNALAASDGHLLWTFVLPNSTSACTALGMTSDATGASYATFSTAAGFELVKLAPDGHLLWQQQVASASGMAPFGVGTSLVYLNSRNGVGVQAFALANGAPAWNVAGATVVAVGGTPAEAVVVSNAGVQRLADSDGQPRWTNAELNVGFLTFATVSGNRLLMNYTAADMTSGATTWHASLPSQDARAWLACAP